MNIICEDFNYIQCFLKEKAGIAIEEDKRYLVESRLTPILKNEGFSNYKDLILKLKFERFGDFHQKVIEAMTTNETSFFRDSHPFESFKNIIIPELIEKKKMERGLNIWSAACSTGQEAYSLAMIINELSHNFYQWDIKIYASDISKEVIEKAEKGLYNQIEINRGMPQAMLSKYFRNENDYWKIKDEIKKMVNFMQVNLVCQWPNLPRQDIIFLRHVLIYFDLHTRREIFDKIKKILNPDGYLILGVGETTNNIHDSFESVHIDKTICYRLKR